MEHFCGREGGEAEGDAGGVLEVGAGVGEEDEGHCLFSLGRKGSLLEVRGPEGQSDGMAE